MSGSTIRIAQSFPSLVLGQVSGGNNDYTTPIVFGETDKGTSKGASNNNSDPNLTTPIIPNGGSNSSQANQTRSPGVVSRYSNGHPMVSITEPIIFSSQGQPGQAASSRTTSPSGSSNDAYTTPILPGGPLPGQNGGGQGGGGITEPHQKDNSLLPLKVKFPIDWKIKYGNLSVGTQPEVNEEDIILGNTQRTIDEETFINFKVAFNINALLKRDRQASGEPKGWLDHFLGDGTGFINEGEIYALLNGSEGNVDGDFSGTAGFVTGPGEVKVYGEDSKMQPAFYGHIAGTRKRFLQDSVMGIEEQETGHVWGVLIQPLTHFAVSLEDVGMEELDIEGKAYGFRRRDGMGVRGIISWDFASRDDAKKNYVPNGYDFLYNNDMHRLAVHYQTADWTDFEYDSRVTADGSVWGVTWAGKVPENAIENDKWYKFMNNFTWLVSVESQRGDISAPSDITFLEDSFSFVKPTVKVNWTLPLPKGQFNFIPAYTRDLVAFRDESGAYGLEAKNRFEFNVQYSMNDSFDLIEAVMK